MAAYLRNWTDIAEWLQDNSIKRWNVSRTQAAQDNNNVFVFDKEKNEEENKLLCERALERFAGDVLYLVGWRTDGAKTGGFSATILYSNQNTQPASASVPQMPVGGLYGVGGTVDIDSLTRDLTARIRNEYDRAEITRLQKQLDDDRKQLRDEQRNFEREKVGTIGILVEKFAPILKAVAGKHGMDLPMVAGIDAKEDVAAARIKAVSDTTDDTEELSAFTDDEADELLDLMSRFKAVEPDYMKLIRAVVGMAEANDSTYTMAKTFLLK